MIAAGHPPAAVWKYTPRQLRGFLYFAGRRQKREDARLLSLHAMASRGDPKELKKQIKELDRE